MSIQKVESRSSQGLPVPSSMRDSLLAGLSMADVELRAVVGAEGEIEEEVDGSGRRMIEANPAILKYARGLLQTDRDQVRFVWIDQRTNWLSVEMSAPPYSTTAA